MTHAVDPFSVEMNLYISVMIYSVLFVSILLCIAVVQFTYDGGISSLQNNRKLSVEEIVYMYFDDVSEHADCLNGLKLLNVAVSETPLTGSMRQAVKQVLINQMIESKYGDVLSTAISCFCIWIKMNNASVEEVNSVVNEFIQISNDSSCPNQRRNALKSLVGFCVLRSMHHSIILSLVELFASKSMLSMDSLEEECSIFGLNILLENNSIPSSSIENILSILVFKCVGSTVENRISSMKGIRYIVKYQPQHLLQTRLRVAALVIQKCFDSSSEVQCIALSILKDLMRIKAVPIILFEKLFSTALAHCDHSNGNVCSEALSLLSELVKEKILTSEYSLAALQSISSDNKTVLSTDSRILILNIMGDLLTDLDGGEIPTEILESVYSYLKHTSDETDHWIRYYNVKNHRLLIERDLLSETALLEVSSLMATRACQRFDNRAAEAVMNVWLVCKKYRMPDDVETLIACYVGTEDPYDKVIAQAIECAKIIVSKKISSTPRILLECVRKCKCGIKLAQQCILHQPNRTYGHFFEGRRSEN